MTQAEKFLEPFSFNESFILFIRILGNLMFFVVLFLVLFLFDICHYVVNILFVIFKSHILM